MRNVNAVAKKYGMRARRGNNVATAPDAHIDVDVDANANADANAETPKSRDRK